jgi:predicted ATP-binding protein involved in virulence
MNNLEEMLSSSPIIELFEIKKLNGFKNLTLKTDSSAKIIVSENGSGKTTLLNALYAILSEKLSKLIPIDFESINIKFHGKPIFSFDKDEILQPKASRHQRFALLELKKFGIDEEEILQIYQDYGPDLGFAEMYETPAFNKAIRSSSYNTKELYKLIRRATPSITRTDKSKDLIDYVQNSLGTTEVLYLPTFRRIEIDIPKTKPPRARTYGRYVRDTYDDIEDKEDSLIWFGMKDVEDQLSRIRSQIRQETFDAYSRLSVQSLEDLLSPNSKAPDPIDSDDEKIRSQLKLVLARLGQDGGDSGKKIWKLIDNGNINSDQYANLRSYLFQMLEIYTTTENDEKSIENFTKVINNYWSTSAFETDSEVEKQFIFDKMSLGIDIRTPYNKDPLQLGKLSSGEKQIVSIFAKLHLQKEKRFIVIIDEPELSLSMAWQKLLLPDILQAPSCLQLIAITHSPFIFENELDSYAAPLFVEYIKE